MDENQENEEIEEKKEFSFMEEKVMESKKVKNKRFNNIRQALVSGIVFGVSAAVCFFAVQAIAGKIQDAEVSEKVELITSTDSGLNNEKKEIPEKQDEKNESLKKTDQAVHMLNDVLSYTKRLENLCSPSLVGLSLYSSSDEKSILYEKNSSVSGIILAKTSLKVLILTQKSAIVQDVIHVKFVDGNVVSGKLYCQDDKLDFAIICVEKKQLTNSTWDKVKPAVMEESTRLSTGDIVFAFGSPKGVVSSIDYGYINAGETQKSVEDYQMDVYTTSMTHHSNGFAMICNEEGQMVGLLINGGASMENCTFYGMSKLKLILENLINQDEQRYSGVTAVDIAQDVMSNYSLRSGIYVEAVQQKSPAYKAGIMVGDVITAVEGERVTSIVNYYTLLQQYDQGESVKMTIVRDPFGKQKEIKVKVKLGTRK
jgi:S1-C subfamily serine protease